MRPHLLVVTLALGLVAGCGARWVDAVVLGDADAGSDGRAPSPDAMAPAPPTLVWPNPVSSANSDPWIAAHHDGIAEMQPRILLLDFANRFATEAGGVVSPGYDLASTLQPLIDQHVGALRVASQYRGYREPSAPAFVQYQVVKVVDVRDGSGAVNSALVPLTSSTTPTVDYAQLGGAAFAARFGFPDPDRPGSYLGLCSLFEKGVINEVWAMTADPVSSADPPAIKFAPVAETKQAYDGANAPIAGRRVCTSATCIDQALPCSVSVRIVDFNPGRGAGCHLFDVGFVWQSYLSAGVLPRFASVARTFFNFDFDTRFGARFQSFYDACDPAAPPAAGPCILWRSPTEAASGPSASTAFDFSPMSAGCGNVVFPPNATGPSVQAGDPTVSTSCENYGLHNGPAGADLTTPYSNAMALAYYGSNRAVASDCGGAQPTYLLASMPGLGNAAVAADGTPMKNWWVYLFY